MVLAEERSQYSRNAPTDVGSDSDPKPFDLELDFDVSFRRHAHQAIWKKKNNVATANLVSQLSARLH